MNCTCEEYDLEPEPCAECGYCLYCLLCECPEEDDE